MNFTTQNTFQNDSDYLNGSRGGLDTSKDTEITACTSLEFIDNLFTILDYITWILSTFGGIGNVLTVILMRNYKTSTATLLTALAISDCGVLIASSSMTYMTAYPFVACHVLPFVRRFNIEVSAWILVVVTIERVSGVVFPYDVKTFFTVRSARIQTVVICLSVIAINSIFVYGTKTENERCIYVSQEAMYLHEVILPWKDIVESVLLPSLLICIGNTTIAIHYAKAASQRAKLTASRRAEKSLTTTLVIVSCTFCITNLPIAVYNIDNLLNVNEIDCKRWAIFVAVIGCMININACSNFYLYVLSGKAFRNDIRRLFKTRAITTQNS